MASILRNLFPKLNLITRTQVMQPQLLFSALQKFYSNAPTPYEIVDHKELNTEKNLIKTDLVKRISEKIRDKHEPLFAVVHIAGKQFKITNGDMIIIEGYWPPDAGDKITLDKIMLVGGKDFSLIGRPLIQDDLVKITATVIEKSVSHTKTHFRKKRRKQYKRINFYRIPRTMLRINEIEFVGELDNPPNVTEVKSRTMK